MAAILRLAAVQMRWSPEDYADGARYAARVLALARRAVTDARGPSLVVFPELVGLPLLATAAGVADRLYQGLPQALAAWAWRRPAAWGGAAWRHRRGPLAGMYAALGPDAFALHDAAFAAAARATGATLVAGSALLPHVTYEAARGWHVADARPRNVALVYAPNGARIGRAIKARLTAGLERRIGLVPGRADALPVFTTPAGRVGVAICLDAWYHDVLERFDGLGADIVVQPSANDAPWRRPWPPDPRRTEEDAWLRSGLRAGVQGRASIRYGVNAMLVGDLAPLAVRGRSTIVARIDPDADPPDAAAAPWGPGLLALAPDPEGETVLTADVPAPASVAGDPGTYPASLGRAGAPW